MTLIFPDDDVLGPYHPPEPPDDNGAPDPLQTALPFTLGLPPGEPQDRLAYAHAASAFLTQKVALDNAALTDTDHQTLPQRYTAGLANALDAAGQGIEDFYNGALRLCGETKLASLSDNRKARYLLDDVWNEGAVSAMLEQGLWYFALRTSKFDADPNITPAFGYRKVFAKPSDWVRTAMLCQDESFCVPLTAVRDESGSWFADLTPIYVSYVSNGNDYGNNFTNWPASFVNAFEGTSLRRSKPNSPATRRAGKTCSLKQALHGRCAFKGCDERKRAIPAGWVLDPCALRSAFCHGPRQHQPADWMTRS